LRAHCRHALTGDCAFEFLLVSHHDPSFVHTDIKCVPWVEASKLAAMLVSATRRKCASCPRTSVGDKTNHAIKSDLRHTRKAPSDPSPCLRLQRYSRWCKNARRLQDKVATGTRCRRTLFYGRGLSERGDSCIICSCSLSFDRGLLFITAVPNTKLCAWGEEDSGRHVL
jgi:hypothetical protein